MCEHCHRDMTTVTYTDKAFHDGWMWPHGRTGYSGVTEDKIAAAQARCQFCQTPGWIPLDPDGLPPVTYPFWRAQEQARKER